MNRNNVNTKSNLKKRFFAGLFDYSIIYTVTYLIFDIWGQTNSEGNIHVTGIPAFSIFMFWFIWTVGIEQYFGSTLGNSIFNLKPISIRKNELKLTFGQSLKRHILDPIDLSPIGFGVFFMKNTNNNQRLGDIWAETVVVDTVDKTQYVKKFDKLEINENLPKQNKNSANYLIKRIASAFIDFTIFAIIMKILESYLGTKTNDGYSYTTLQMISFFFTYLLIQDLIFRKTLGKRIFKLEIKVLENNENEIQYKYLRIVARRIFDIFEIVCPFIYLISISVSDKNQKLGDKISKILVTENKNYG
jgi:uncharacterized RDD family membrane protein YckC